MLINCPFPSFYRARKKQIGTTKLKTVNQKKTASPSLGVESCMFHSLGKYRCKSDPKPCSFRCWMHRSAPPLRTVRITQKFRAHQHWNANAWVYLWAWNLKPRWAPLPKRHQTHKPLPPSPPIHLIRTKRKVTSLRTIIPALREVQWPQRELDQSRWCGPGLLWIQIQSSSRLERGRLQNWRW